MLLNKKDLSFALVSVDLPELSLEQGPKQLDDEQFWLAKAFQMNKGQWWNRTSRSPLHRRIFRWS
jgi:hypothetical protein